MKKYKKAPISELSILFQAYFGVFTGNLRCLINVCVILCKLKYKTDLNLKFHCTTVYSTYF